LARAAFSSVPFLFAFSYAPTSLGALCFIYSSPRTRLGLVRAWMIGGRGNGKTSSLYESSAFTVTVISPKIAYRFPPVLFHSSRGVHHTTSSCAKRHRGERVPRYVVSRLFHRAIRASSHHHAWTHHLFICLLPFLTSSSL
jgi:hypothetical protein